ncbi:PAS domain S-box protein [Mycobacterium sp. MYCO198283]|uniref:PAS domain S-box protein n=1 Tax=Mycobacterium sp. MYCO198283 TaxID=2883505 RepID=UPI001E6454CD|nr:PAS domain S-box protein [Mycobacterium sp. MYCO198283]MCG5434322.1 PAS domain S-box protein [Mycobacterium sp. MYCO198283]
MEARSGEPVTPSPTAVLEQLPAPAVLERLPVPVLAVGPDGTVLFANPAFAEMLGHARESLLAMTLPEIVRKLPPDDAAVSGLRARADMVVELCHADGSIVRAEISRSELVRGDDSVVLATFRDLTEELWVREL